MTTIHPAGQHLRLLLSEPQGTEPVVMHELMDTAQIEWWQGLPPVPAVARYERPRRFDRLRTWIDTSPVVDGIFCAVCLTTGYLSLVALGTL